jgi:hypothetical protein
MQIKRFALLLGAGVLIVVAAWLYLRPAWFSENSIRASLLKQTPLGSSIAEVRALAEKKHWLAPGAPVGDGIYWVGGPTTQGVEGAIILSGRLQHDPFPYRTQVGASWLFDSSNRLVAVYVLRHE